MACDDEPSRCSPARRPRLQPLTCRERYQVTMEDEGRTAFSSGEHDSQSWYPVDVGQREEHFVRPRIDGHGVRAVRQERLAERIQRAAPTAEDRNDAALGRYV